MSDDKESDKESDNSETVNSGGSSPAEGTEIDLTAETIFVSRSSAAVPEYGSGLSEQSSPETNRESGELVASLPEGRYRIHEELGSGAMGVVHLAEDSLIQRQVAVKTLKLEQSEKRQRGFLRETRVQGCLQHPNIVTVYDAGVDKAGEFAIVMQYIQGQNLSDVIDRLRAGDRTYHQRFSLESRLDVFGAVVNALSYAHNKGLIHCDVKPANVIIGDHGEVWLADWGIARRTPAFREGKFPRTDPAAGTSSDASRQTKPLEDEPPQQGAIFGTPRYMSPEQAQGNVREVDGKSDLYSAFILLYELLTLSDWISSKLTLRDTLEAAANRSVPSIHDAVFDQVNQGSVPTELRYFLQKGLACNRDERFADCGEVLHELLRIRNGDCAIRCPITLVKRLQTMLSHAIDRRPQLVIFLLLFAFVVWVGGLIGGVLYAVG